MNSKSLQDKVQEIEEEAAEMRLLKRSNQELDLEEKDKVGLAMTNNRSIMTVDMKHYDQLICEMRCPGCTALLHAPIYLCMSGHSICRLCRSSMKTCPVCHEELSNIRSLSLEKLSGKFQFPCKNLRNGCTVRLPFELMNPWHEDKCVYKKTSCFMGKIWHDCDWRGRENEWLQHCKQKHAQKILKKQEVFELCWNFETLKNNAGPIIAYYLIQNYGETFNLYQIHEAKKESLTWTVILANYTSGPTESKEVKQMNGNLPQFCFEIEFFSKKDPRFLLVYRLPVHYEDSEDVLDDGRCVKVSLNEVKRFLDDDQNLYYHVKIKAVHGKKDRWDELLDKAIYPPKHHQDNFSSNDFAFFDSNEGDDRVFMDDEKLVVVRDKPQYMRRDDDLLKQVYEKEFSPKPQTMTKPPRKSLENRNSLDSRKNSSRYSSHSSMRFDD